MNRFAIAQPRNFEEAQALLDDNRFSLPVIKAAGMDVLDHVKEGLTAPDLLINVRGLYKLRTFIGTDGSNIRIEAHATLAHIARSQLRSIAPVLAQAAESAATPQIRNVATIAGNLLQRPRCWYYRNKQFDCLKKGGHTCYAAHGENRYHAIFGDGPCHIVHPSNLAPALAVCSGTVQLLSKDREDLTIDELFHMPDRGILDEHNLHHNELITSISLNHAPISAFYAIKEKQSFDWPLVMAAVALELDGTRIESAKICAGAVAPIPWRLPNVEKALIGVDWSNDKALRQACSVATDGAKPMSDNAYKLKLLPVAIRRAILKAANREDQP